MTFLRRLAVMAAIAVSAIALTTTTASAAKSHKMSIKAKFTQSGTKLTGTYSGAPFGSGKATGTLVIPTATITLQTKGGSATLVYDGVLKGTNITGKFKFTKGTGKLKNIKGSGIAKGTLAGDFTYTGVAIY